jgi:Xaa-Pro dipeptidase
LKASRTVQAALKPGVSWVDMHLLAERVTLEGLKDLGLVNGDIDEMMENRLGFIF